jgi:uncharacterized protein (DUF305 family)
MLLARPRAPDHKTLIGLLLMNKLRFSLALTGVLAATFALSACSSNGSMGSMGHSSSTPNSSSSPASDDFNDADVSFASEMVVHHQQAIGMADMLLSKDGVDDQVASLANRIKAAQQPEIDTMNGWLDSWSESTGAMEDHDMGDMNGSMSHDDMNALMNATAIEANRLFLTQMTTHHEGAIEMSKEEISSGQNTDAIELARKIVDDQTGEIKEMKDLRATL